MLEQIKNRRTFAIISHPDAGKTTITEKLLLYGGAINMAGSVKAKKSKKHATSDWMELEKQRGISVTSSVMAFPYKKHVINLIDTPGHQDFSEDTYRTLTAVDSAVMLLDAASGVEEQTLKLFKVCRMQKTPLMAFINKMDRPGKDPFDLLKEIEDVLGIATYPINWPVGMGEDFQGVYDRIKKGLLIYRKNIDRSQKASFLSLSLEDPKLEYDKNEIIGLMPNLLTASIVSKQISYNSSSDGFLLIVVSAKNIGPFLVTTIYIPANIEVFLPTTSNAGLKASG